MIRHMTCLLLLASCSTAIFAHGNNSHFPRTQDVTVRTTKVTDNIYMLQGRGGNVGAVVGPEGILIVDDDYREVSKSLAAALKELGSDKPRFVLNTHWHGDHTQGNEYFGKDSTIVAHVNVRKRLLDPPVIFGQRTPTYPAFALPIVTYTESMTIHINGENVRLVHFPNGHTDGDSVVFFEKAKVVHLGDTFFAGRFPFVDIDSGGSVQGLVNNIGTLINMIPADAKLIPGHGSVSSHADLKNYHAVLTETVKIVTDAMKAGKTLDEIKEAGFPVKFNEAGSGFIKTPQWIETIHRSYSTK
ncbi:MAG: MBL fold metallo-hydrolase [Acidobacteria bacterium]|nr:MBL fold metallo-hydrolase [Acidobacteriota bacterium]